MLISDRDSASTMTPNASEPLQTESLALQAYGHFRRALMNGQYVPGQKVKLKEVADELGISQTPIREALCMLVSEQILTQVDRRSVRVPIILADRYCEIRDLRIMLEGEAAERTANISTRSEISQLAEIHERMCLARDEQRFSDMLLENVRFHLSLCNLARMPILYRVVENLWLQCGPMMNAFVKEPPESPRKRHPHLDVIRGLRAKNAALAKKSIQQDIAESSERILRYLKMQQAAEKQVAVRQGSRRSAILKAKGPAAANLVS